MRDINKDKWIKPFENAIQSLKIIGKIKYGLLETKEDHCYIHKQDYINEYYLFPSGKTEWNGCPICRDELQKDRDMQDQRKSYLEHQKRLIENESSTTAQKYTKAKGY